MTTKINNIVVKPIRVKEEKKKPPRGEALFSEAFANIFLCAKKKSGKTSVINTILKHCASRDTMVVIFCSTVDRDANWIGIQENLENAGIPFVKFPSIKDDNGVDRLQVWLDYKKKEYEEENQDDDDEERKEDALPKYEGMFDNIPWAPPQDKKQEEGEDEDDEDDAEERKRRSKYQELDYIFVFDDLSDEIKKATSIPILLKTNRHYKMKTIISSQYIHDLKPECLRNADYYLLWSGLTDDKLKKIYKDADLAIDFDFFENAYHDATNEDYSFLYVDTRQDTLRKRFDREYVLPGAKK